MSAYFQLGTTGNQGHVVINSTASLVSSSWTILGWVYHSGGTLVRPIYTGTFSGGKVRHALSYGDVGVTNFWAGFYDGSSWTRAIDTGSALLDEWLFYAGTYDGANLKLYRGVLSTGVFALRATTPSTAGTPSAGSAALIGAHWETPDDQGIVGSIAEPAMIPSALSQAGIEAIWDQRGSADSWRSAVMAHSPGGYWRLRDFPGVNMSGGQNLAIDETGNTTATYFFTEYQDDQTIFDHRLDGLVGPISASHREGWGMLI